MRRAKKPASKQHTSARSAFTEALVHDDVRKLETLIASDPSLVNRRMIMLKDEDICYWTPLCWAVQNESINSLDMLLKQGADPYQSGYIKKSLKRIPMTPFSLACSSVPCKTEALIKLLELGVCVDQPIPDCHIVEEEGGQLCYEGYMSGLHYSLSMSNLRLTGILLEFGANVRQSDAQGNTPLHLACENCEYSTPVIFSIMHFGGISNSVNTDFLSPLGILWQNTISTKFTEIAKLTKYMIYAGYDYHNDQWYIRNLPGGSGHTCWRSLLWLMDDGQVTQCRGCQLFPVLAEPLPLKANVRAVIRRCLSERHNNINKGVVNKLPLPGMLIKYVFMIEDYV